MSKLPSTQPRGARNGSPNLPTAGGGQVGVRGAQMLRLPEFYARPQWRSESCWFFFFFFAKQALSLQSCASWRTQPASFPPWPANFHDFLGFCSWRLQPGSSWVGFDWFWLDLDDLGRSGTLQGAPGRSRTPQDAPDICGTLWDALGRSGTLWDALGRSVALWGALGRSGPFRDAAGRSKTTPWTL